MPIPEAGGHQRGGQSGHEPGIAQRGPAARLPGGPRNGREDHHRGDLDEKGQRGRHGARHAPRGRARLQVRHPPEHRQDRIEDHRRVGDEEAAEEHGVWRDRHEECRRPAGRDPEQPRAEREHRPDRSDGERHADQPADDRVLPEDQVEQRRDPVHQREFHPYVRLVGAAPVHLRVEDVHRPLGEVAGDVRVRDLAPAMRLRHRQIEVLAAEQDAEQQDEEQREIETTNGTRYRRRRWRVHVDGGHPDIVRAVRERLVGRRYTPPQDTLGYGPKTANRSISAQASCSVVP